MYWIEQKYFLKNLMMRQFKTMFKVENHLEKLEDMESKDRLLLLSRKLKDAITVFGASHLVLLARK